MIKRGDHLDDITATRVDQGHDARVHAAQVVEPAGGEELMMRSKDRRRGRVVHPEVVAVDVGCKTASRLRHMIKNMNVRVADTPHRLSVGLLIEPKTFVVHTSIKMDRQLWNPHDRVRAHQQYRSVTEDK